MDQTTTPAPVNPADTSAPVTDMAGARAKRAEKASKAEGEKCGPAPSVELRFTNHLRWRTDIAVGGRGPTGGADLTLYQWKGTHWCALDKSDANQLYLDWAAGAAPNDYAVSTAKSATETAATRLLRESERDLTAMSEARGNEAIIPTPDGYVRIGNDGRLRILPIDKTLGITYCVPAHFDHQRIHESTYTPAPVPPESAFGRYLDRFFPDLDVRALLQEVCASTLLPICYEKAFVFCGTGANGKSTMLHLLRALHPNHAAFRVEQAKERFGNQALAGKSLLITSEVPVHIPDSIQQSIKALISRDPIEIECKKKDPITIIPRAALVMATNAPLRFTDRTYGNERKYLHIPFSVRLADDDPARVPDYHLRITDDAHEMAILLDWLLVGAQRLLARGRLPEQPDAVRELVQEQRRDTDSVFAWIEDSEVTASDQRDPCEVCNDKSMVYAHYRTHSESEGCRAVGAPEFWRRLREHFGPAMRETRPRNTLSGARGRAVNLCRRGGFNRAA